MYMLLPPIPLLLRPMSLMNCLMAFLLTFQAFEHELFRALLGHLHYLSTILGRELFHASREHSYYRSMIATQELVAIEVTEPVLFTVQRANLNVSDVKSIETVEVLTEVKDIE